MAIRDLSWAGLSASAPAPAAAPAGGIQVLQTLIGGAVAWHQADVNSGQVGTGAPAIPVADIKTSATTDFLVIVAIGLAAILAVRLL